MIKTNSDVQERSEVAPLERILDCLEGVNKSYTGLAGMPTNRHQNEVEERHKRA